MIAVDFLGHEIKAGHCIVYIRQQGALMWLDRLRVTQVTGGANPPTLKGFHDTGRRVMLKKVVRLIPSDEDPTVIKYAVMQAVIIPDLPFQQPESSHASL